MPAASATAHGTGLREKELLLTLPVLDAAQSYACIDVVWLSRVFLSGCSIGKLA